MQQLERSYDGVTHLSSAPQEVQTLEKAARQKPTKRRRQSSGSCLTQDIWIYRIVVSTFAGVLLITAASALVLSWSGTDMPDTSSTLFIALASGAIGALAGLLAPSPKG
jgi:hypothetical protein